MPILTPRQRLTERVAERLHERGFNDQAAYATAVLAVHAWYGRQHDAEFIELVHQEAMAEMVSVIPEFARHLRTAFEGALANVQALTTAAAPWVQMAEQLESKNSRRPEAFDASGLPREAGDRAPHVPVAPDRQGEPCIEEGCGATAVPGTAFCADCQPDSSEHAAVLHSVTQDLLREAEIPAPLLQFGAIGTPETSRDGGNTWGPLAGVLSVEIRGSSEPTDVVELTTREWHMSAARSLRNLGCTYAELIEMARSGDFATGQHHSLWFNINGTINREQLDRAEFVLTGLEDQSGVPADIVLSDQLLEELERDYPIDRITGAPHHYIVNGDHSSCGCNGHSLRCETWNVPTAIHKPTICEMSQTNCRHSPRHTYGQLCDFDWENFRGPSGG